MPYKIGTLTVGVVPDDAGFEADLRERIKAAADGVNAEVGLRLGTDAEIFLDEDIHAAIDLATEGVKAKVGLGLTGDAVEDLDADVKAGVDLVEQDAKVKVSVDPKSSKDTQDGISGMIIGAIAAAAAFTPGAVLTAASVATVGLGVLVNKSNADIQATYHHLAGDVGDALSKATAPLVPAVEASMVQVDGAVEKLKPTLDSLFTGVEPDLYTFTSGLTAGAQQFLPEFSQAVGNSRGIVADFANGLPSLLGGAGQFFTGLTTDSASTGRGFEDLERITGSALGTAGQVIGSFSAAASSALDAITPAATSALTVISKLASPETIGGLAGGLAVKQWGSAIESGLQSASDSVLNFAAKADGVGGIVGRIAPAAESASSGLSTMAGVMGGPWGIAIGAGIGLLGGLVSSFRNSASSASDFTAAIAQDSGMVGSNTDAVIQQTLAKSNLSDLNQQLGVSTSTLIAYAAGDKDAQEAVTAAYQAKTNALSAQAAQEGHNSRAEDELGNSADRSVESLANAKAELDQVTSSVAQAIEQNNEQTKSLEAAEKATSVFTQQVNAEKLALQQAAQTALVNATALNQSLAPQGQLSGAAINAALAYQQATSATSQYTNALEGLYGQYGDTSAAEASFTTALSGLKGQITSGTNAVNLHTKAGAANYTAFQQAATAAETYSEKIYQQTGDANQANIALSNAITQIDGVARQSGLSATQVQKLNEELFGVKSASDIKINVDDSQVFNAITALEQLEKAGLNASQDEHTAIMQTQNHHATGGPSFGGQSEVVGDAGHPEIFVPDTNGYVYSTVDAGQRAIATHNAQVAASAPAPAMRAAAPVVHQYFYGSALPSIEQRANLRREMAISVGAY